MKPDAVGVPGESGKLGTFAGVFTPSILTILGIILFLRLGYVVGQTGLGQTLIILVLANGISILTSMSLSAIATNLKVKGGGDYYLISRTLGLEFGGAIGIVLFLAQSVSIAFYCIGFGEVAAGLLSANSKAVSQIIAAAAISFLFVFAWLGADWATKFQYGVMAILALALVSFYVGGTLKWDPEMLRQNFAAPARGMGFWPVFAIFFPAVTGFTQGVSMSGDLKDAGRSLPLGTFLAVGVSIVVYFTVAVIMAATVPQQVLTTDYTSMKQVAAVDFIIDAGVIAATLSSAMASFLGAPRILQSLAGDRIFPPLLPFARGNGPSNNPRRGVLLSAVIAYAAVAVGNLNLIAPVVAMFFLISYGLLNYATFFEIRSASPSFRPRFKWYDARLSLLGGLTCLIAMLAINWAAGAVAIAILFALYQYLKRTAGPARWADSRRSYHLQQIRENLLALAGESEHPRNWRPQIVLFSDDDDIRRKLLVFASWISGNSGLVTAVQILEGGRRGRQAKSGRNRGACEAEIQKQIKASDVQAFSRVIEADTFLQGIHILIQSFGIGPLRANTALFDWPATPGGAVPEKRLVFGRHLKDIFSLGCNFIALHAGQNKWDTLQSSSPQTRRIDVWWWGDRTSRLMLLLAYLMTRGEFWESAKIRVLAAGYDPAARETVEDLHLYLEEIRIEAEPEIIARAGAETVVAYSGDAALVFLPLRLKGRELVDPFGAPLEGLLQHLPPTVLVMAAQDIDLDAEPEEGRAGEAAAALDQYADARKNAKAAEEDAMAASATADEKFYELLQLSSGQAAPEDIAAAKADALTAKENALKEARRAAMANAGVDQAQRRLTRLGISSPEDQEKPVGRVGEKQPPG